MDRLLPHLHALRKQEREFIICADWNICHKEIDLKNWKANQKNSGFLAPERAWLDRLYDELGYIDAFRLVNPNPDQYTWWSNRGQAWAKNVGWRLDYQVITPGLAAGVRSANIYKDQRFSDHAPLIMEYDL
jgi:exodeoxyribonuclease-3